MTIEQKRKQVADQYRVVAHLCKQIARVHEQLADVYGEGHGPAREESFLDMIGRDTASRMEILGNMLNNMDAVDDDEDGWTAPIFAEAQRLWPWRET